jgi:hypothetical protein
MTDIKRLKEIEAKLQQEKEVLEKKYGVSSQQVREINGKITDVQIPIIEWEIEQRDKKEKTIFRVDFSYMNLSAEDTELLKKHVYRQLNKIENGFIMEKFEVLE